MGTLDGVIFGLLDGCGGMNGWADGVDAYTVYGIGWRNRWRHTYFAKVFSLISKMT